MYPALHVIAVGFLTFVAYYIFSALYLCLWGSLSRLPGPIWTSFTTLPDIYHTLAEDRAFWIHGLHQKYGPAVRTGPNAVSVTGVDTIKKIHGVGSKPYPKWSGYTKFIKAMGSDVECAATIIDSTENARRRKIYAPHFTRQALIPLSSRIEDCMVQYGGKIERQRKADPQGVVDVLRPMRRATLDVITEVAYGGSWKGNDETGVDFAKILDTFFYAQLIRALAPPLYNFLLRIPLKSLEWVHSLGIVVQMGHDSIESYIRTHRDMADSDKPKEPLADILFSPDPETGVPLSRPEQELEALVMLVAGVDTSAVTAALTAWEIVKHPQVVERLQRELDHVFPDASIESTLKVKEVETATWLTACIKEGMRLHPAVPGPMPRVVPPGGAMLAGFAIPQDTVVFVQPYTAHRDVAVFPDPEAFRPERWLAETSDMKTSFVAFSQGPRLCLGYNLAWIELRLLIAFLFRNYNVLPAPGPDMEIKDGFTLHPKGGDCPLLLKRRDKGV